MRYIIAIEPAISVAERLVLLQEELDDPIRQLGADVRWTPAIHLRLVLRILSDLDEASSHHLFGELDEWFTHRKSFEFSIGGTQMLPSEDLPRMITVGPSECAGLGDLRDGLNDFLSKHGVASEPLAWEPSMLIGRIVSPDRPPALHGLVNAYTDTAYGSTTVREIVTCRSEVIAGIARTSVLRRSVLLD